MGEMDILADKCTVEIIEKIHKTCHWALTGDQDFWPYDQADEGAFNEAHSYLVQIVANKVADKLHINYENE